LAFVNSRRVADRLVEDMKRSTGFKDGVFIHHSSISRDYRVRAICVAMSILELGIDIGDVDLALLYDFD